MDAVKEWVRGLVVLVILASLLELLLPMNGMKKFVRMAMGFLIMLGVVRPIVGLLGQPITVEQGMLVAESTALPSMSQIMVEARAFEQKNQTLLMKEAEARLTAEARAAARRVDGVSDAQIALRMGKGQGADSDQVEGVTVTVMLGSRFGRVRPVNPVQVDPAPASPGGEPPGEADAALAEAVRREVAAQLGLTDVRLIQVLVDRPGQSRR